MPAILTHDFFGRAVLEGFTERVTPTEREAFLLGNQGPDPFFYLAADRKHKRWEPMGDRMHHERPAWLLLCMREAVGSLPADEELVGQAYVAGFLCHYLLDRSVHPLVYHYQYGICSAGVPGLTDEQGNLVHAEIERDLDEAVLFSETGMTIEKYRPYEEVLQADDRILSVVDRLYFYAMLRAYEVTIDPGTYTAAVESFRRVQHLFYSAHGGKLAVLGTAERAFTKKPYSFYCSMAHRNRPEATSDFDNRDHAPWRDPFTGAVRTESFWDLRDAALALAVPSGRAFLAPGFDLTAAHELTHDLAFSGAPVGGAAGMGWPDAAGAGERAAQ